METKPTIKEISAKRIAICKQCEYFCLYTCQKCGCLLPAKTRMKSAVCPIYKWMPE